MKCHTCFPTVIYFQMGEAACYEPVCPECKKPPPGAGVHLQLDPGGSSGHQGVQKESWGDFTGGSSGHQGVQKEYWDDFPGGSRGHLRGPEKSKGVSGGSSGLKKQ